jgi:hypothetical protein
LFFFCCCNRSHQEQSIPQHRHAPNNVHQRGDTLYILHPRQFPDPERLRINGLIPLRSNLNKLKAEFGRPDSIRSGGLLCSNGRQLTTRICYYGLSRFHLLPPGVATADSLLFEFADFTGIRIYLKEDDFFFYKETKLQVLQDYFGIRDSLPENGYIAVDNRRGDIRWLLQTSHGMLASMQLLLKCSGPSLAKKGH